MPSKAILVIDPSSDFIDLVAYLLGERRYQVQGAFTLTQGLMLLDEAQFDLIMTEAFKQSNPYDFDPEFLDDLHSKADDIPIVLCSIYSSVESLQPGDHGLAAVITKPVDINYLEATLLRILDRTASSPA